MQHREWNPKAFFRHLPSDVITLLEDSYGVSLGRGLPEELHDQAYIAFTVLPDSARDHLQADLLMTNDMCSTHARPYLNDLARFVWRGDASKIDALADWSVQELAVRLFIADRERFAETHGEYALDSTKGFAEFRGVPMSIHPSKEKKARMRREMIIFAKNRAGGARCQVEDFETRDKIGVFVYREDELKPVDQFNDSGLIVPVWQRPVLRIAALFYPDTGSLMIKASTKVEREELRDLFASIMVGEPGYFEQMTGPIYSFEPLRDPAFSFGTNPAFGIDMVCIVRIVGRPPRDDVNRVALDLPDGLSVAQVHVAARSAGLDLRRDQVDQFSLRHFFSGKGRSRTRTVEVSPGGTNLADVPRDRIIRRCLREWRFDDTRRHFALATAASIHSSLQ